MRTTTLILIFKLFFLGILFSYGQREVKDNMDNSSVREDNNSYCAVDIPIYIDKKKCFFGVLEWAAPPFSNIGYYEIILCDRSSDACVHALYTSDTSVEISALKASHIDLGNTNIFIVPFEESDEACMESSINLSNFEGFKRGCPSATTTTTPTRPNTPHTNHRTEGFAAIDDIGHGSPTSPKTFNTTTSETNCFFTKLPNPIPAIHDCPISYELSTPSTLSIIIYNSNGQVIEKLVNNVLHKAGNHQINWPTTHLPEGVYFISLQTPKEITTQKLVKVN